METKQRQKARTLTKIAISRRELGEIVKRFSPEFQRAISFLVNTVQFWTYNKRQKYLMGVSQQVHKMIAPAGYNIIVTITSSSEEQNRQIAENFQRAAEIELKEASRGLSEHMNYLNQVYPICVNHPDQAIRVITGRI